MQAIDLALTGCNMLQPLAVLAFLEVRLLCSHWGRLPWGVVKSARAVDITMVV